MQLRKAVALLPHKKERPIDRYSEGSRSEVRIFERFEKGEPKRFVERLEIEPHENPISRFHVTNILNILHSALPDVFPATIEVRSLRFENKKPVMGSVNIDTIKSVRNFEKVTGNYLTTLRSAGFDFEEGPGDIKFVERGGKFFPVIIEVYGLDFHKFTKFINQLSGNELKKLKPIWKEIVRRKKVYIADLINGLNDKDPVVRLTNADTLGEAGDKTAIPALERILGDENNNVRIRSAFALGKMRDRSVIPSLEEAYSKEQNKFVKECIRSAINNIYLKT